MASGILTQDSQVNDRVKIVSEILYDAMMNGYDSAFWYTASGAPASVASGIQFQSSRAFIRSSFYYGRVDMYLVIADAPGAGQQKMFGITSPTPNDMSKGAMFWISNSDFSAAVSDGTTFTQVPITWNPAWTNTTVKFSVDWQKDVTNFFIDDDLVAEVRVDRGGASLDQPCGVMMREFGVHSMILRQLVMFVHSVLPVSPTNGFPAGGGVMSSLVYGSPDNAVTQIVVPVQNENSNSPTYSLQIAGSTGPTGLGQTKALKIHAANEQVGSMDALNIYNSENGLCIDSAQSPTNWVGNAEVGGITNNSFGIIFNKVGAGSVTALISNSNVNVNADHLSYGQFQFSFKMLTTNVSSIYIKIGTNGANYGLWTFYPGNFSNDKRNILSGNFYQPNTAVGTWGPLAGISYIEIGVTMNAVGDLFTVAEFGPIWIYRGVAQNDQNPALLRSRWVDMDAAPGNITAAYTSILDEPVYVGDIQEVDVHWLYTKGVEPDSRLIFLFAKTATGAAAQPTTTVLGAGTVTHTLEEHVFAASGDYIVSVPIRGDYMDIQQKGSGGAPTGTYRGQIYLQNRGRGNVN